MNHTKILFVIMEGYDIHVDYERKEGERKERSCIVKQSVVIGNGY